MINSTKNKKGKMYLFLAGVLATYTMAYGIFRFEVFHAVENYPDGKGGFRQDYIAKKDQQPYQGWEYYLFFPAIKTEEFLSYVWYNSGRFLRDSSHH
ncbi:MAG: hypothetical protein HC916_17650 [Coleofasciculaceae cyanobacterium SM2_1_6]|nr:hypothetical protein [Coleofasciculaceae cyanobacterium SM2_1_6]